MIFFIYRQLLIEINMTPDTQILQELVEAVNRPDWWTIGITSAITIINAAIMVWLGWNQYKLQKRQTEAQEYEVYKRLYLLLSNANNEIDNYLQTLKEALWEPNYNVDKEFLQRKQAYLEKLQKDLMDSYVDYELKFSKETFNKDGYLRILSLMSRIVHQVNISLEKNEVMIAQGVQRMAYETGKEDEAYAANIANHFKTQYLRMVVMQNLMDFAQKKKKVRCDDVVLERIRTKCKID